jgi:(p)ppGpp synthase/HD superfamily hydrolase
MTSYAWRGAPLLEEADAFAAHHHEGQLRKYVGGPYVAHPRAVARLVRRFTHDAPMVAAALLHDVAEDCGVSLQEIERRFGSDVAGLVRDLTDVSRPQDGNRAQRKAIDRAHTAAASPRAKTIKACDLIHNTASIVRYDPTFAGVYLDEKGRLLPVLHNASDPRAVMLAQRVHARGVLVLQQAQAYPGTHPTPR